MNAPESVYNSADELFKAAEQKGIIRIGGEEPIQESFLGISGTKVQIQILKPKKWIDFLNYICTNTKNSGEHSFANNLLNQFKTAMEDCDVSMQDVLAATEEDEGISEEQITKLKDKLNKIMTVEELLASFDKGEL